VQGPEDPAGDVNPFAQDVKPVAPLETATPELMVEDAYEFAGTMVHDVLPVADA